MNHLLLLVVTLSLPAVASTPPADRGETSAPSLSEQARAVQYVSAEDRFNARLRYDRVRELLSESPSGWPMLATVGIFGGAAIAATAPLLYMSELFAVTAQTTAAVATGSSLSGGSRPGSATLGALFTSGVLIAGSIAGGLATTAYRENRIRALSTERKALEQELGLQRPPSRRLKPAHYNARGELVAD